MGCAQLSEEEFEEERLSVLNAYSILDTPPEGAFDNVATLAATILDVPIAIISLVDRDRIWFKSHYGLEVNQIDRVPGLCGTAFSEVTPYVIPDTMNDARTKSHPLVAPLDGFRFYAGIPLINTQGFHLGCLCVLDHKPRTLKPAQIEQLVMLSKIVLDQMELRLRANELEAQKATLNSTSKLIALGEMAAGVAHEVNNPLSIISSLSMLMRQRQSKGTLDEKALHQSLDNIDATVNRISRIVIGLKNLSRSTEDGFDDIFLGEILTDVLSVCQERFRHHDIKLSVQIEDEDRTHKLHCNAVQISQVLLNLLSNAFDAVQKQKPKWVNIKIQSLGELVRIAVVDSGPGISEETKKKMFNPFFYDEGSWERYGSWTLTFS